MNIYRREGRTIRQLRNAVRAGDLPERFNARQVNEVLGISWAGTFLPKHRVGNPGRNTELFLQVNCTPALYMLITGVEHIQ